MERVRTAALFAALAVAAVVMMWPAGPALADDSSVGGIAGNYHPLANTDIRMESETVQAVCYRDFAEFRVDFRFVNSGAPQTLMLGFPFMLDGRSPEGLTAFRAWQDGTPLAVTTGQGESTDLYYYLHQATFPTGATMISVSYIARPSGVAGERFPESMPEDVRTPGGEPGDLAYVGWQEYYEYWLHTGAGWAGTIGKAVVRFTLADDFQGYAVDIKAPVQDSPDQWPYTTRPETYTKVDADTYQWVFTDLEPTERDDIFLEFTCIPVPDPKNAPAGLGAVIAEVTTSNPPATVSTQPGEEPLREGTGTPLQGKRPWMRFAFPGNRDIREIRIVPGNNGSNDSFKQYGRPKTVKVTLSDGTSSTIRLADEPSVQRFPISGKAGWVRFDVIDSYPGTKSADVCFTTVDFGSRPAPGFEPFATLVGAASASTATTAGPQPSTTTSAPGAATSTSKTSTTAFSTGATLNELPVVNTGSGMWTVWPIALIAVAGAAFIAAVVFGVLLFRRRGPAA